jgi:hypothetical protein
MEEVALASLDVVLKRVGAPVLFVVPYNVQ